MSNEEITIDEIMNVCRLCLGTEDLISLFDNRMEIPDNIPNVVQVTTGVTITRTDNVSQKLCNKCLHITVKMLKFRTSSINNDMQLKTSAEKKLTPVLHKTVEMLLKKYPRIILPPSIARSNISPVVKVNINEIINWKAKTQQQKISYQKTGNTSQLVTEPPRQSDEFVDVEKRIMPYLIPNKEISVRSNTPNQTEEILPTSSSDMPTLEIVEPQKLSKNKEILEPILNTKNQDNKAKRRLSNAKNSAKTKKFKSNDEFDSGNNSIESLVTLKYVTKSLLICDICNGILYTAKDLKKHKIGHMKCHLCKKTFRSLKETKRHKDSECIVKRIMNNLPTIILERCDQSEELRKRYPLIDSLNETREKEDVCCLLPVKPQVDYLQEPAIDIKEEQIVEDFEEEAAARVQHVPVCLGVESQKCNTEAPLISDNENDDESSNDMRLDDTSYNKFGNATVAYSKNDTESTINTEAHTASKKNTSKPKILSNASLKPDIKIIGKNTFDVNLDGNEVDILKYILKKTENDLKEQCAQTEIPCNEDIQSCFNENKLFCLKNLKKFLSFNKVKVNLSFAKQHSIKFSADPSSLLKKGGHWSKHVTKIPVSSETLPVNLSPKNTIQNNTVPYQIINNTISPLISTSSSIDNKIQLNNFFLDTPSDAVQQSSVMNLQNQSNSVGTFLLPTILPPIGSYPQVNNTFSIAGHSILGTLAVMNPNFNSEIDLNNLNQNSIIKRDYIQPEYSILSQAMTNAKFQQMNGVENNSTSNNIILKNVTGGHLMNIQTPQIIQTSYNGYSQANSNIIQPKTLFFITPAAINSEILSSTPSQIKFDSPTSVTSSKNSKKDENSTLSALRIKNLSELQ